MTFVGIFGILLGLLAYPVAFQQRTEWKIGIFTLLYLLHLASAIFYFIWAQTNTTDATLYYYDEFRFYGQGFRLGTGFVIYFVQALREMVGGTYLDYFLLFHAFGFWAVVAMMRIIEEIHLEVRGDQPKITYLLLFIPTIHFFTSAIGKDGPLVLGSALCVWAAMQLRRRYLVFAVGIFIMLLFRPHIALMAMMSLAVAVVLDGRTKTYAKVVLLGAALSGAALIAGTVRTTLAVDVTSAESLGDFFATQNEVSLRFEEGTAVHGASYPVRLLSLLFRPFFFDAPGLLGLVASMENILMLIMVGRLARRFRETAALVRQVFFLRYALIFTVVLAAMLAAVYYNVGLGLRQRTMFMPALIALFVALVAVVRARREASPLGYATPAA